MDTQQKEQKCFLLVCVEKPIELASGPGARQWFCCAKHLASISDITGAFAPPFENVWLFPEESGWRNLEKIKPVAAAYHLQIRCYKIRGTVEEVKEVSLS